MSDKKLMEHKVCCEICHKDNLGISWYDGEYICAICYKCIDKVKNKDVNSGSDEE